MVDIATMNVLSRSSVQPDPKSPNGIVNASEPIDMIAETVRRFQVILGSQAFPRITSASTMAPAPDALAKIGS
jgi:hypothetical protein